MRIKITLRSVAISCVIAAAVSFNPVCAGKLSIQAFSESDGLPNTHVRDVVQDSAGRMWFATRGGLVAYDGLEWKQYGKEAGLDPVSRMRVVLDDAGDIWTMGSVAAANVAHFDGTRWSTVEISGVAENCLLFGIVILEKSDPQDMAIASNCGLLLRTGGKWEVFDDQEQFPNQVTWEVVQFDGALYIGTNAGVLRKDSAGFQWITGKTDQMSGPVLGFAHDTCDGSPCLWILGPDWLGKLAGGHVREVTSGLPTHRTEYQHRPGVADGNGGLIFGSNYQLYHFNAFGGLHTYDVSDGLAGNGAWGLARDHEGGIWVASLRGVSRITGVGFETFGSADGLFDDEVTAVLQLTDGRILLGHNGGLTIWDDGLATSISLGLSPMNFPSEGRVLDLAQGRDGSIWIAGSLRGLGRLKGHQVTWSKIASRLMIASVLVDEDDQLWVAADSHVYVDRGDGLTPIELGSGEISGVRRLVRGADGAIYACTMITGTYRIDVDGSITHWYDPSVYEQNDSFAVHLRSNGEVWLGTAAGLFDISTSEQRRVTRPYIDRPIYFIVEDEFGNSWFGTDDGVLHWDGKHLGRFSVEEGLGGRETNRAAGMLDDEKKLWIGTTAGVTVYRPEQNPGAPRPPRLKFVEIASAAGKLPLDVGSHLSSELSDISFRFRAISYSNRRALKFQSRLKGYEQAWSKPYSSLDQIRRYTNLPPGRYQFMVRSQGSSGVWGAIAHSPEFVIRRPLLATGWFWILLLSITLGGGLVLYRQIERRRIEKQRQAEEELIRSRQLESLGQLAGGIAHDFNNLLTVLMGNLSLLAERVDSASQPLVVDADRAVERARELTNQLLTFSRGGSPVCNPERVESVIRESVSFVLSGSNVRADFNLDEDLHVVDIDAGQINQVLNNLLINAVQAMPEGGVVRIEGYNVDHLPDRTTSTNDGYVAIAVKDSGTGINAETLPRIFDPYFSTKKHGAGLGLSLAYSIARRHGGLLTVETSMQGSTFVLYLPATQESEVSPEPTRTFQSFDPCRVLVMDDESGVRGVFRKMVERLGCRVEVCECGTEALEIYKLARLEDDPIDVVVLDLTIPGAMGGEEAMRRLREYDPYVRGIVTSGYANSSVMAEHQKYGFNALLRKPFTLNSVAEALRCAMSDESPN